MLSVPNSLKVELMTWLLVPSKAQINLATSEIKGEKKHDSNSVFFSETFQLRNLVRPSGGSKRPAVVFIGAKAGGLTNRSVNLGSQGTIPSKMALSVAFCFAASSELISLELFWLLNSAPNSCTSLIWVLKQVTAVRVSSKAKMMEIPFEITEQGGHWTSFGVSLESSSLVNSRPKIILSKSSMVSVLSREAKRGSSNLSEGGAYWLSLETRRISITRRAALSWVSLSCSLIISLMIDWTSSRSFNH